MNGSPLPGLDLPRAVLDPETFSVVAEFESIRPGFVADIIGTFISDSKIRLKMIDDAIQRGDAEAMWKAAHTLKSSCGIVGASRTYALCQWLEDRGRAGSLNRCADAAVMLHQELAAVSAVLAGHAGPGPKARKA